MEPQSRWTYALLLGFLFILMKYWLTLIDLANGSCEFCGHIREGKMLGQSTTSEYKRHIKHVEGHYVNDYATTTKNYKTSGTSDHSLLTRDFVTGYIHSKTSGTTETNLNTTETDTTVIKRWVEGYDVDEGLYKHTSTVSTMICPICQNRYKRVGISEEKIDD